jgi:hypothetical protein
LKEERKEAFIGTMGEKGRRPNIIIKHLYSIGKGDIFIYIIVIRG